LAKIRQKRKKSRLFQKKMQKFADFKIFFLLVKKTYLNFELCSTLVLSIKGFLMKKSELVDAVAAEAGLTKVQAEAALKATFNAVSDVFKKGDSLTVLGFGTFKVQELAARKGVNPKTGEALTIPARKVPKFQPSSALKESLK
jgi:nucleoid DNA-binding protein